MRWFDPRYDYVNEFIIEWNKKVKKLKWTGIIIALAMIAVGICCGIFPMETFAVIQTLAAAALMIEGVCGIIGYAAATSYFKDPMQIVSGILNILLGIFLIFMPAAVTVSTLVFLLGFLLLFHGAERLAVAGRLKFYRLMDTGFMTFGGVLDLILAVVFLILPLFSALVLNYIIAAYLIVNGIILLIEAISMKTLDPHQF